MTICGVIKLYGRHLQLSAAAKGKTVANFVNDLPLPFLTGYVIIGEGIGHIPFGHSRQRKERQPQAILGQQPPCIIVGPLPRFGHDEVQRGAGIGAEGNAVAWFQVPHQAVGDAQGVVQHRAKEPDGDGIVGQHRRLVVAHLPFRRRFAGVNGQGDSLLGPAVSDFYRAGAANGEGATQAANGLQGIVHTSNFRQRRRGRDGTGGCQGLSHRRPGVNGFRITCPLRPAAQGKN